MSYEKLIGRLWNENLLFSTLIELTYRCNLDCFFCYNDVGLKGKPLSRDRYFRFFQDLREMGTMNVTLSGGEPLAHRDFLVLGEKARELGFVVRIKSNGHAINGKMARRIKERIDPYSIEVSLHGARAETHDRQTRVPGSFDRLMRNLPEMLDLGLRLSINSPLTRWNQDEMEDIYAIGDRLGVRMQMSPQITPRDNGDSEPLAIAPSAQARKRLDRLLKERSAARLAEIEPSQPSGRPQGADGTREKKTAVKTHCGSGSSNIVVDPYGSVFPCVQWRRSIGNLHRESIKDIWTGSHELSEIRRLNREVKGFIDTQGPEGRSIGFCPGMAEQITGSPVKLYPYAEQRLQDLKKEASDSEARESAG